MARLTPTPAEVVALQFAQLRKAVVKLLIENVNFAPSAQGKRAHYFAEYPNTQDFVRGPLKSAAEHIVETVDRTRELAMDMAAPADVPGFVRTIEGTVDGWSIRAVSREDGKWDLSFNEVHGFDGRDDASFTLDDENAAIDAIRAYVKDRTFPIAAPAPAV